MLYGRRRYDTTSGIGSVKMADLLEASVPEALEGWVRRLTGLRPIASCLEAYDRATLQQSAPTVRRSLSEMSADVKKRTVVVVSCLTALLLAGRARAEYDCQCYLPDAGATIQMYFQGTNNGPDAADVANVKVTHKGSSVTCASDYLQDPVFIECTNWGTSSHEIYIAQINCAIWEPASEPPADTLHRSVDAWAKRYEELRLEYEQLDEILRVLVGTSGPEVPRAPGYRLRTRVAP